jgi:YHS domain-containing protein
MDSATQNLLGRIDQEFAKSDQKLKTLREGKTPEDPARAERLALFEKTCESLKAVWRPRLEALKQRFGDKVKLSPTLGEGRRQATFEFISPLAKITLRFTATTDVEFRGLVLEYRLELQPVLMTYSDHDRLEQPIEKTDGAAIGAWIDDRIVEFVKTYLSLHENEFYLQAHLVEDPVNHIRFPKFAAEATLERDGKTLYFISASTKEEFEKGSPKK